MLQPFWCAHSLRRHTLTLTPEASLDRRMKLSKATLTTEIKRRPSPVTGLRHKLVTSNQQTETVSHAWVSISSTREANWFHASLRLRRRFDFCLLTENNGFGSASAQVHSGWASDFLFTGGIRKIQDACQSPSFLCIFFCLIFFGICKHFHFSTHESVASLKEIISAW